MKFKEGQKARVIDNIHHHKFEIGEEVTIKEVSKIDYKCYNEKTYWYLIDEELEEIT